jgi:catechol 2,3-dioxygenase-like lactoylglutathione lyase family enzyme
MTVQRMDHVGVVVDDMEAAIAFFVALGLEEDGRGSARGDEVGRIVGIEDVETDFAMMAAPDGRRLLELIKFNSPESPAADKEAPSNTPGLRHLAFAVDEIDVVLPRLRAQGGELVGEVVDYGNVYRLCYVRGPAGIIVELAEPIG